MFRLFFATRYFTIIGIVGLFIISIALYIDTFILALEKVVQLGKTIGSNSPQDIKKTLVGFIRIIDLFFVATAFHFVAVGLYKVAIDQNLEFPKTIRINNFDDLKKILINTISIVLMVVFLEKTIEWETGWEILGFGSAIAFVIGVATWSIKSH